MGQMKGKVYFMSGKVVTAEGRTKGVDEDGRPGAVRWLRQEVDGCWGKCRIALTVPGNKGIP